MRLPRSSGILLHPTSLPGPHGSGDLGAAAHHFVDWLQTAGQRLWQILPLGGIGPGHSPYMSPSAFAGNVLLVDLQDLADHGWLDAADLAPAAGLDEARVDFDAVIPYRMARLAKAAARFRASRDERSAGLLADFQAFCRSHASWLDDYAVFMALCEAHPGAAWPHWPPALARREPRALADAAALHAERIAFWRFCQWRFFHQWARLKAHANARGVRILGDAPIFVAHASADVWAHPALFELDGRGEPAVVAGVPPDYFSATGQRWGNPLYRWPAHAATRFAWWIERVRRLFELVDVVRIDHFRGFAAHWEIPASSPTAIEGRWVEGPGAALFEAIGQALGPLPIVAEDLGIITPEVEALRKRFAFPGMRVLQFAFSGDASDRFLPHHHEPDAVVYAGTHDNDTTAGWWRTAAAHERAFVRAYFETDGHDIAGRFIRAASASVADTAIHSMQDVLGLGSEGRMNFPGQPSGWWEWRFRWSQVQAGHAERLAEMGRLHGR